jgi:hypothetical protein
MIESMSRIGLWIVIAAACSSSAPRNQQSPPQPQSQQESRAEETGPLAVAACPKLDEPKVEDQPPPRARLPGRFGTDGLQPRETPTKGATCQAARTTLDTTNATILKAPKPAASGAKRAAWDRKLDPARWSRVAQRFGLDERHRANLARDGFVVSDQTFWTYVEAYHEVFQSQLPIFVSIDSIMHAIYASHAGVIGDVEKQILTPKLAELLSAMHCGMAVHAKSWPSDIARDVDLYLTVARSLLAGDPRYGKPVPSLLGNDDRVKAILKQIAEPKGLQEIELFGRRRMIDFNLFTERGRYSSAAEYFRAMTWLSRIELNLVSRGSRSSTMRVDTSETPREAGVALALVELAAATNVLDEISKIDGVWGELAGKREDVSFAQLDALRSKAKISRIDLSAQPALAQVIGKTDFKRTMPIQITPDGVTDLPVIAAMFGARISPDTSAFAPIVQPAIPQRFNVGASDVGFILGHDRAKAHMSTELQRHPTLDAQLGVARATLDARMGGTDLYSAWLRAIRALATKPTGTVPSFMKSDAYADLRLSSTIAAFGQLRTSYELMSGMAYLGSGCEIPDGYVEPAVEVYDALLAYAERGKQILAAIDPTDRSKAQLYFTRLHTTLKVLRSIIDTQLADQPLSAVQKRWLSMVVEIVVDNSGSGAPPTYAGWYFDLFRNFQDATADADFVTGIAKNGEHVFYVGGTDPRMGVFVVDTGGAPRVVTGPVARPFETSAPLSDGVLHSYSFENHDPKAKKPPLHEPWAASYLVSNASVKPPLVDIQEDWDESQILSFTVTAESAVGPITLRALDHHRVPIATLTKTVGKGKTVFRFGIKRDRAEMVQLSAGKFHSWSERSTDGGMSFHYLPRKEGSGAGED